MNGLAYYPSSASVTATRAHTGVTFTIHPTPSPYYRARGASIASRTRKSWADREAALLREGMALLSQRDGARAASALLLGYAEVAA